MGQLLVLARRRPEDSDEDRTPDRRHPACEPFTGVTIETSGGHAPAVGSEALLLQLTTNLVHNAIAHNVPGGGTVWVTASTRPDKAVLIVENTGDQLTPQLVCTLVEPFHRGSERVHSDPAGVGLGLAIVNSITRAHDGTLTLTPRTGGGLRVTVQLPAPPSCPRPPDVSE